MKFILLSLGLAVFSSVCWYYSPKISPEQHSWETSILSYLPAQKELYRWKYIVIHHSASAIGNASIFHEEHLKRGWDGLGYHFVIGNGQGSLDGAIEIGFRWKEQKHGAHAGDTEYNQHGIGICLVGNFEETSMTSKQRESLRLLLKTLTRQCQISEEHIVGHSTVKSTTLCPGKYCSIEEIRNNLK
ncbi:MAG: peptidoglycan recognition family protein [Planctomycetota bacterium]